MQNNPASPQFDKWVRGLDPRGSVSDAARYSLRSRLAAVQQYFALAAIPDEPDIEDVHQLRVATRRSLSALELYRGVLPGKPMRALRRTVKEIQRAAGALRDLDVLAKRYRKEQHSSAKRLVAVLAPRRSKMQKRLVKLYIRLREGNRFASQIDKLLRKAQTPGGATECWASWTNAIWPHRVSQFFQSADVDTQYLTQLHHFRICGKELRYALELLAPAFDPQLLGQAYPFVEQLQERLGRINDRVVAREMFREWNSKRNRISRVCNLNRLRDREFESLRRELRDFEAWWTPALKKEMRQALERLAVLDPHVR